MATKNKPSELAELAQLAQLFAALQEPELRQQGLELERARLAALDRQQEQQTGFQDRQFQESVRQFNQQQDFRKNDSLLDLMARLGNNPNIDADVLMGSLGEIDPRVGEVVNKSNKAKSEKLVAQSVAELEGIADIEKAKRAISTLPIAEQEAILAGLPNLQGLAADEARLKKQYGSVPRAKPTGEKPKRNYSPGGLMFGAY